MAALARGQARNGFRAWLDRRGKLPPINHDAGVALVGEEVQSPRAGDDVEEVPAGVAFRLAYSAKRKMVRSPLPSQVRSTRLVREIGARPDWTIFENNW